MKFVDEAVVNVHAGKGGAGSAHFKREKFIPKGGPDGGNGGVGGSVILVADRNKHTLLDFKFQPRWSAGDGQPGRESRKDGRSGEDLEIHIPIGTEVYSMPERKLVVDLSMDGERFILVQGGRGGKGNSFFKSSTNRAPDYAQPGESGEDGEFILSLKLVADVGLIGFPNAGKSTLISRLSSAKPKIADYPFTTLKPNLGVVKSKGSSFVLADIPGLIPGAHAGKGLGIRFLKHIERTKILVHLIDSHQRGDDGEIIDPLESYNLINRELRSFSGRLSAKPQIVALTKSDTSPDRDVFKAIIERFREKGISAFEISSVSGAGLEKLTDTIESMVRASLPDDSSILSDPGVEDGVTCDTSTPGELY